MHKVLLEEEVAEEEEEEIILGAREKHFQGLTFIPYDAIQMDMILPLVCFLGIELSKKRMKEKVKHYTKGMENHSSPHIKLWHIATMEQSKTYSIL